MGASVVNASSLSIFNPLFKDPQALHGNQRGLLLDIDVQTSCISNTQIQITLPATSDPDTGNGHFSGTPFSNVPVTGISTHSHGNPASASVSWDGETLTFSNFVGATRTGRDETWINFNFATATSQIPLNLVLNEDSQDATPFVNVNKKRVFTATNNDAPCQDAQ